MTDVSEDNFQNFGSSGNLGSSENDTFEFDNCGGFSTIGFKCTAPTGGEVTFEATICGGTTDAIVTLFDETNSTGNIIFKGTIDEVSIWSRALTTGEVLELYKNGQVICNECNCGPADTNKNNKIDFGEIIAFIQRWIDFEVQIRDVINAIGEYKNGC